MSTPLSSVIEVIETLKSTEVAYANADIPVKHAKLGVIQASISLDIDWNIVTKTLEDGTDVSEISADLTAKQIYLCGLYAMRNYALQDHHGLTQKAVNFKTINFAVSGLTERAKEAMRFVSWLDTEIANTLAAIGGTPMGSASEMGGSTDDTTV